MLFFHREMVHCRNPFIPFITCLLAFKPERHRLPTVMGTVRRVTLIYHDKNILPAPCLLDILIKGRVNLTLMIIRKILNLVSIAFSEPPGRRTRSIPARRAI